MACTTAAISSAVRGTLEHDEGLEDGARGPGDHSDVPGPRQERGEERPGGGGYGGQDPGLGGVQVRQGHDQGGDRTEGGDVDGGRLSAEDSQQAGTPG